MTQHNIGGNQLDDSAFRYRATKQQERRRAASIKNGLINAGSHGMTTEEMTALLNIEEPHLIRSSVANYVMENARRLHAVRSARKMIGKSYVWYNRGTSQNRNAVDTPPDDSATLEKARASGRGRTRRFRAAQKADQPRVITFTLPTLPRITPLRAYAVAMTVYAVAMTALEVWRATT